MTSIRWIALLLVLPLVSGCAPPSEPDVLIHHTRLSAATHRFESSVRGDAYAWSFGDGEIAEGRSVEHVYDRRGTYTVNLNVYRGVENHHVAIQIEVGAEWTVHGEPHPDGKPGAAWEIPLLQQALEQAEEGDTVWVSGEFGELVLEEKSLEIRGDATFVRLIYRGVGGLLSGITLIGTQHIEEEARPALILDHASPRIEGCTIQGSSVDTYGGGIFAIDSAATVVDCVIAENSAGMGGGGAYVYGATAFPRFVGCTFRDNRANAGGGGILMRTVLDEPLPPETQPLRVEGCLFVSNRAQATFGGAPVVGGAIHIGYGGRAAIVDCTFSANGPADVVFEDPLVQPH